MAIARAYFKGNIPEKQVFRGQAALILTAMSSATDKDTALTTAAIADKIKADLQTRQDPERVVAFYMSVWKKKGWVRAVDVTTSESEAEASNAADSAPQSVQDEVGGIDADAHNEIQMEVAVEAASTLPDLRGKKLSEAVFEVLNHKGLPMDTIAITDFLNKNGYPFTLNQVNSAAGNLLRKEMVKKDGDNYVIT